MLLLHTADLHLGVESYGRLDPNTGLSTRLADFLSVLDEAVDCALQKQAALFLFCGDAYKSRSPSPTQQREFARRVERLARGGVAVFLLAGNHDLPHSPALAHAVEIFATLGIARVYVAAQPGTYRVETRDGPLQVIALPWVNRSVFLGRDEARGLTLDEVNRKIEERVTAWVQERAEALDPALPAVLAAHATLSNGKGGSEKSLMMGHDPVLLSTALAFPALDYVALGHLHRRQVLGDKPPQVYPGSLQHIDFSEEGQEKGFYLVDVDPLRPRGERVASFDFRPVAARPFVTVRVDAQGDDPTRAVLDALARRDTQGAVVRVEVALAAEQVPLLRENEVRQALATAHSVNVVKDVRREQRLRLGRSAEALKPLEALDAYLQQRQDLAPDRRALVAEYGRKLVAGDSS